jgi:hypothetical protein
MKRGKRRKTPDVDSALTVLFEAFEEFASRRTLAISRSAGVPMENAGIHALEEGVYHCVCLYVGLVVHDSRDVPVDDNEVRQKLLDRITAVVDKAISLRLIAAARVGDPKLAVLN